MLTIIFKSNNVYENHHTNPIEILFVTIKEYYENKFFYDFLYPLIKPISTKQKYIITVRIPKLFKKILFFSSQSIRMSGKSINFYNKKNLKSNFYNNKNKIFNIDDIDVHKILVSKKEQYSKYNSFKYFIGYNDNDVIRPLYLGLSQITGYIHQFDKNENKNKNTITMSLKVNHK